MMLRKFSIFFMTFWILHSSFLFASNKPPKLSLKIEFTSTNALISDQPLHFNKTLKIDVSDEANTIVMTESRIVHSFPVTLTMLVKPIDINKDQVALRFHLLQYGFNQHGSVIIQPGIILKNGESAQMRTEAFQLKVKAKWS